MPWNSTGQAEVWSTLKATLPRACRPSAPMPCVLMTMRSASLLIRGAQDLLGRTAVSDNALELKAGSAAFVDERLEVRLSPPFGLRFEARHLRHVGVLVRQHHSQRSYLCAGQTSQLQPHGKGTLRVLRAVQRYKQRLEHAGPPSVHV